MPRKCQVLFEWSLKANFDIKKSKPRIPAGELRLNLKMQIRCSWLKMLGKNNCSFSLTIKKDVAK